MKENGIDIINTSNHPEEIPQDMQEWYYKI